MSKTRLTISQDVCTETLALLITMAWADGTLEDAERDGVRAAAKVLNLSREMRERIDQLLEAPLPLDELLFDTIGARDRAFAFVAAAWMSNVDRSVAPSEIALLDELAQVLEIDAHQKEELLHLAEDLNPSDHAHGHWSENIVSLFKAIPARLMPRGEADDDVLTVDVAFE